LDPRTGVSYSITTQTPQYRVDSLQDLENIPISSSSGAPPQILGNLASISRGASLGAVSHYNVQPVINIYGSVQGRDLGGVASEIDRIVDESQKELPRGSRTIVRGQIETMRSSFSGLLAGLVFSIVLVYLLIVVNFQSWLDPFIILMALPGALGGIVLMLFIIAFFGLAWSGISLAIGLRTRSAETVFGIGGFLTFPLLFMSTALVPVKAIPDWMASVSSVNPISFAVNAIRDLSLPNSLVAGDIVAALAVILGIAIVTLGATLYLFRKVVS
jgi:hypothetical protein